MLRRRICHGRRYSSFYEIIFTSRVDFLFCLSWPETRFCWRKWNFWLYRLVLRDTLNQPLRHFEISPCVSRAAPSTLFSRILRDCRPWFGKFSQLDPSATSQPSKNRISTVMPMLENPQTWLKVQFNLKENLWKKTSDFMKRNESLITRIHSPSYVNAIRIVSRCNG